MINFVLLVNKQGQTRLAHYTHHIPISERMTLESEVVRKCLSRSDERAAFFEYQKYKLIYRRYASLFFIIGVDDDENELAIHEFIHNIVETFDRYFESVCELDLMFSIDRAYFIIEEMVSSGHIMDANKTNALDTLENLDRFQK
eukprot:gb/GECH01014106.1/.p1 GENE.gb/GECH01014106.1/~~gb/GECH01014106.1/.p1  ORF type:complete len:144 (+),score=29.10 gb/GECH01014106.1/:1-432(+)